MYRRAHEPAARERQADVERGAPAIVVRDLTKRYGRLQLGVLLGWTAASFFAAVAFFHWEPGNPHPWRTLRGWLWPKGSRTWQTRQPEEGSTS